MKHRTVRVAVLAAAALGLALAQQACANGVEDSSASAPAAQAKAVSKTSAPATTGTKGSRSSGSAGGSHVTVPVCRSQDMVAEVTFQPERVAGNTRMALVALTNKSKRTCTLDGRAAISLTDASGSVVGVPVKNVAEPGAAVPITLKPGRAAFEGIKWTVCDKAATSCGVGNGMLFNLEASTDGPAAKLIGFPAAEKSDITMKSLSIGTLQPSTQGVVAW